QNGIGVAWPDSPVRYQCNWPATPDRIVIASEIGSELSRCRSLETSCRDDSDCNFVCNFFPDDSGCREFFTCIPQPLLQTDPQCGQDTCFCGITNSSIYSQPDPMQPGYNPNEEHAFLEASNTGGSQQAVYALRNDLNDDTTSKPYVLL